MTIQLKRGTNGNGVAIDHQRQSVKKEVAPAPKAKTVSANQIAIRAYEIWQKNGCRHGEDRQHWLQAERELLGQLNHK